MYKIKLLLLISFLVSYNLVFTQTISILHTNDLHAHILKQVNASGDSVGGFAQISALINKQKQQSKHPVFVADAGDFLMGTLFQMIEMESGFQLNLMHKMGYDALCIGNHEFDFGIEAFAKYTHKAKKADIPSLVLSNIDYSVKNSPATLAKLYSDSIIKPYTIIEKQGVKVAFIGILGETAYEYTPNLRSYKRLNSIKTTQKIVKTLKEKQRVDFIICLSHSGVYKNKKGSWDISEDIELAKKVKGIDAIISGHTHTYLNKPLVINGVPIVQTACYGNFLGKLTLEKSNSSFINYETIPVKNNLPDNASIKKLIDTQFQKLKDSISKTMGIDYHKTIFETNFPLAYEDDFPHKSTIGKLVADAIYYNVTAHNDKGTDISLIAQGMIRSGLSSGHFSLPQVFEVASLGLGQDNIPGYSLSRLYFTGHEIKLIVEMLEIMAKKNPSYYCHYSGIKIEKNAKGGFFNKIAAISIIHKNGTSENIDFSKRNKKLYAVSADTYMIKSLATLKKKSFGLVKVYPKTAKGTSVENINDALIDGNTQQDGIQELKVWQSLLEYAKTFIDTDENGIPEIPAMYNNLSSNLSEN